MSTRRCLLLLIAGTTLLRVVFAAATGLGVDESYMVAAGRTLSLGYFDHPPAAWWLSWGAAHLFGTGAPWAVRLPFILLFALSTWLVARLGAAVADERAGLWAAVLLNLSPVFGITSGTWVLPDGPLDCALLGAALCLARALGPDRADQSSCADCHHAAWRWWLGAGACAGLALFAKYSAVLTIAGACLFLLASPAHRPWLRRPHPYVAGLLALAVFAPVLVWNAGHAWASFAFQGERAFGGRLRPLAPLTTLAGEALFVLPWIWVPLMVALIQGFRRGSVLSWLAAGPITAFALIPIWSARPVLYHWAAPGYLMLFPLLGAAVPRWLRRTVRPTAVLVLAAAAIITLQVRFDVLGSVLPAMTRSDPTAEGIDWTSVRADLAARGLLPAGALVGLPNWRDGGKLAYALGPEVPVVCLNEDARQFGFANPVAFHVGQDMLLLNVERPGRQTPSQAALFERIEPLPPVSIRIGDRVLAQVTVARGINLLAWKSRP